MGAIVWRCAFVEAACLLLVQSPAVGSAASSKSLPDAAAQTKEAARYIKEGIKYYRSGRETFNWEPLERAKKYLAHAVALDPRNGAGYFYLGSTLSLLNRPKGAVKAYSRCMALDPNIPSVHQNLGQAFEEIENRSASITHYRRWAELEPQSAAARRTLATALLWIGKIEEGTLMCKEAVALAPKDSDIPYSCARMLVLFWQPEEALASSDQEPQEAADGSSKHWVEHIEPHFRNAQLRAFQNWRGGPVPNQAVSMNGGSSAVMWWSPTGEAQCPKGAEPVHDWSKSEGCSVQEVHLGGEVYGERVPLTFGGAFTWAGQRYTERTVQIATLRDVLVSGNEGVITRGCEVFVPFYDVQIPWHENLPRPGAPKTPVRWLPTALWLLVMFPANFFSFLVDELARLAVWLVTRREKLPLLVPADRGKLKPFMYDWLGLFAGFKIIPYNIRPHFQGFDRVSEPRYAIRELHVVDWRTPSGTTKRGDVFLLPPKWAIRELRNLAYIRALGTGTDTSHDRARPASSNQSRVLLWIQRKEASTRRVVNEEELFTALRERLASDPGPPWELRLFSDVPSVPGARETVQLFHSAHIVLGVHGSGQANQIFCRTGTGIIDVNLPEPHSQYAAHTSYALGFPYRLVMLTGASLHQQVNLTLPVNSIIDALSSLLPELA
mmetsp:Transcript_47152/g.88333  ORF Transcript_47152/g.88333 Transcript_47152/m.88333 type:complete len:666 (+) Transcript_47152:27-2024(+)